MFWLNNKKKYGHKARFGTMRVSNVASFCYKRKVISLGEITLSNAEGSLRETVDGGIALSSNCAVEFH